MEVLEREYGSWQRLVAGSVAALLAIAGIVAVGIGAILGLDGELATGERLLGLAAGVTLGTALLWPGWRLGIRTIRAGRRVVDALVSWHRLPEVVAPDGSYIPAGLRRRGDAVGAADRRRVAARDATLAHTYVFRGPLFIRIAVAGLLLVAVLAGWGMAISSLFTADPLDATSVTYATMLAAVALVLTIALVQVLGGSYRVNAAHARRDPVAGAILGRGQRLFGQEGRP